MKAISVCITALTALLVLLYVLKHKTRPTLYVVSCDNFIVQWCWTNKIRFHLALCLMFQLLNEKKNLLHRIVNRLLPCLQYYKILNWSPSTIESIHCQDLPNTHPHYPICYNT